jgi:hypothetical protein
MLTFLIRLLLALIMPSSLRLRLFTARLFLALFTSGSLWLRLFPARLLSALIKPGSLRLLPALITSGSLRLLPVAPASSYFVWLFTSPAPYSSAPITAGSQRLRLLQRGIIYILISTQNQERLIQPRLKFWIKRKIYIQFIERKKKYLWYSLSDPSSLLSD